MNPSENSHTKKNKKNNNKICKSCKCGNEVYLALKKVKELEDSNTEIQCKKCRLKEKEDNSNISSLADRMTNLSMTENNNERQVETFQSPMKSELPKEKFNADDASPMKSENPFTPGSMGFNSVSSKKSPKLTPKESETKERRAKLPLTNPQIKENPFNIYCGGGTKCGFPVEYNWQENKFPSTCCEKNDARTISHRWNSNNTQCYICKTNRTSKNKDQLCKRNQHQCNWDSIFCVHNQCVIDDSSERDENGKMTKIIRDRLDFLFTRWCCPICNQGVHGGVISRYGVIVH